MSSKDDAADSVVTAAACIEVTVLIATVLLQFVQRVQCSLFNDERDTTHERAIDKDCLTKNICWTATRVGGGSSRTKRSQRRRDRAQAQFFYDLHFGVCGRTSKRGSTSSGIDSLNLRALLRMR
ncbi:transmembrane protein, putative [Bodo saltans]|uniref:Transmembrane protein, putative n=1 Tax=Bodo saltans TaxID=75058 RepID=A0A0S4J3V9_BODSA|nr:transmembrane protein, putative [Bodo saltans]|eukprot:CUG78796.1 transmembrane protein, putative [Bodo saltans]